LSGELAGERGFVDSLDGRVRFSVAPGELHGVSILEATFALMPTGAGLGVFKKLRLPKFKKPVAPALSRYYGDRFDFLGATLDIVDGRANTKDFRLTTSSYELTLAGSIRLADLGLSASGQLRLGNELSSQVGRLIGGYSLPGLGGLTIPLTRIEGTLLDPKPKPEWNFFFKALSDNIPILPGLMRAIPGRSRN
jgi:hypothetical protein